VPVGAALLCSRPETRAAAEVHAKVDHLHSEKRRLRCHRCGWWATVHQANYAMGKASNRLEAGCAGGHESEHQRYRAPRWGRARAATPPERSISPVVGRQGPVVTQFEAFWLFSAPNRRWAAPLAGRPRDDRENLPGFEGGRSWTV